MPASISVFNENTLRDAQTHRLDELTLKTPNLNAFQTRGSASNGAIFIRGIGQEDTVFTVESGVGLYVDDVFMPRAQASLLQVFDIDRIEVLRGPQGTLYGRNTIAGAIRYITKKAENEFASSIDTTIGNYGRGELKASMSLPLLSDRVMTRSAFAVIRHGGFERDLFSGRHTANKNALVGRTQVLFKVSDDLNVNLSGDYYSDRSGLSVGAILRPLVTAPDFEGLITGQQVTIPVSSDPFLVRSNTANIQDVDHWGLSSTITWSPREKLQLKSVTSYRQLAENGRIDFDSTEARVADVFLIHDHEQWSQELQANLSAEQWDLVGGLYYFHEFDDQNDGTDVTAKGFSINSRYDQQTDNVAAYANADYRPIAGLTLNAGARISYETKTFNRQSELHFGDPMTGDDNLFGGFDSGPNGNPPDPLFPGNGMRVTDIQDASESWTAVTPRAGVSYAVTGDVLTFASIARGFKSGGFNGQANEASNPMQREPFEPEFVWTYEAGVKSAWLDRQLLVNVTGFYNDYTDLQLASFNSVDTDGDGVDDSFLPLFTNAGSSITTGFELEVAARPLPWLNLSGGAGFTHSEFKEYLELGVDISDERDLPNAPRWTATGSASVTRPVSGYVVHFGGGANYQGPRFLTVSNLRDLRQTNYVLFDAFAAIAPEDKRWRLTIAGKNLSDERYLVAGLDGTPPPFELVTGFYGPPRTWSITLGARFF